MKEDDEGIRFHTLLTALMHRCGRILPETRAAAALFLGGGTFVHGNSAGHQGWCRRRRRAQRRGEGAAVG
jgi:hypothetical protein